VVGATAIWRKHSYRIGEYCAAWRRHSPWKTLG